MTTMLKVSGNARVGNTKTGPGESKRFIGMAVATALGAFAGSQPALSATDAGATTTTGMDEIVVTARRKEETLQDVPLSITAISSATLKEASATNLQDISFLTPGLTYTSNGAQANAAPTIRGLSDTSGGEATSSNVSVFLDGIYIANPSAIDVGVGGLERVEVVKGPVSGLYGRNAFTGAINYVTAKPTNDYHADADITAGDAGRRTYDVNLSGPIISDILKIRVAGSYDKLAGTFHDPVSGEYGNGYVKKDGTVKLSFTPDEHISVTPTLYVGDDYFTSPVSVTYAQNCALGTSNSYCGNLNHAQIGPYIASPDGSGATGLRRQVTLFSVDARADYFFGSIDLLYGYNGVHTESLNSFDGTEFGSPYAVYAEGANNPFAGDPVLGVVPAKNFFGDEAREHDKSIELRYDSPQDYFIRVGAGGYYLDHDASNENLFGIDGKNIPPGEALNFIAQGYVTPAGASAGPLNYSETIARDISPFFTAEWDILPTLTLSAAVRYTDEFQRAKIGIPTPEPTYNLGKDFYSTTANAALTWKPTKEMTYYIAAANGEKSGGFNAGLTSTTGAPILASDLTFNPETDVSFEAGTKLVFLDRRLQVNADVFHTTIAQSQQLGPAATPGVVSLVVKNFGDVTDSGFELEANYDVGYGLTAGAGLSYSDPKFENGSVDFNDAAACKAIPSCFATRYVTVDGNPGINLHGLKPPYESDWTFNTTLQYTTPLGVADLAGFARADYRYEGKQYNSVANFAEYGPRNVVNLHVGVKNETWKLTLFLLNATNNLTPVTNQFNGLLNGFDAPPNGVFGVTWVPTSVLPEGRTYGATISYHF
jgi:iron complex outermembrane receptor protein